MSQPDLVTPEMIDMGPEAWDAMMEEAQERCGLNDRNDLIIQDLIETGRAEVEHGG